MSVTISTTLNNQTLTATDSVNIPIKNSTGTTIATLGITGTASSSGTTVTVTTACTNAYDCLDHLTTLLGNITAGHVYIFALTGKSPSNYETDQLITLEYSNAISNGFIYSSSSVARLADANSNSTSAAIAVGDVFTVYDVALSA